MKPIVIYSKLKKSIEKLMEKLPTKHEANDYELIGEDVTVYRIKNLEEVPYTVAEISSPQGTEGQENEATLTLMRQQDSVSGGVEFLDLFNNGYDDHRKMGVRIQSRGGGTLRDFVFEFNDGTEPIKEVFNINKDNITAKENISLQGDGWRIINFEDSQGNKVGHVGKGVNRISLYNEVAGSSFDFFDSGIMQFYSPSGDHQIYLDTGGSYVNDDEVLTYNRVVNRGYGGPNSIKPALMYVNPSSKPLSANNGDMYLNASSSSQSLEIYIVDGVEGTGWYRIDIGQYMS